MRQPGNQMIVHEFLPKANRFGLKSMTSCIEYLKMLYLNFIRLVIVTDNLSSINAQLVPLQKQKIQKIFGKLDRDLLT